MGCTNYPKETPEVKATTRNQSTAPLSSTSSKDKKENKENKENILNKEFKENIEIEDNKKAKISLISINKDINLEMDEEDKNSEKINFKQLFMDGLPSSDFINLFKENSKLYYSKAFYEGIFKEYGLFGEARNKKEAFDIYKKGADDKNDYLCM